MRTTLATRTAEPSSPTFPRAATVRISALATAFLTGTTAISLLVAPAAGATSLANAQASAANQSVATTWGHDDKHGGSWNKPKPTKPTPAPVVSTETKTVAWLMPKSTKAEVSWPQELVGTVPACGTGWYQVDVYRYGTAAEKKFVDDFMADGILSGPQEDGKAYISHTFVQPVNDPAVCNPAPAPTPTPEVPVTPPTGPVTGEVPVVETPTVPTTPVVTPPATPVAPVTPAVPATPAPAAPVVGAEVPASPPVSGVGGAFGAAPAPSAVAPVAGGSNATAPVTVANTDGQLAATGAKVGILSALAAAFVAAGIVAFRFSRRAQAASK